MASTAYTSAGSTLFVSAALPATNDVAGFTALTWTKVAEIVTIGAFGRKYNLVSHNPIDSRGVVKRKGSYNNGTLQLKMAKAITGAGQAILKTAENSDLAISCRVTEQNGAISYFAAACMGCEVDIGGVDQITGLNVTLEVTEDVVSA